ncbi:hypothetical protein RHMOL_Rhmol04G0074700 [Rhododendron molle]|uniref:Uncharacterized protein n=1 Tax=Rhododendron molle TaxID=49168 RepID=A0ACC0NY84_RHOML|nr:hypothetical protein RHMOL_Rhmol04G0074700 [Rhododendron molle]
MRKYSGEVAFNNITRLVFGKRFVSSDDVIDDQGLELKAIVADSLKLGASLSIAEHIPWLRWMFPLDEGTFAKLVAQGDQFTRAIIEEHTAVRHRGGPKHHFVDALLMSKEKYDLIEITIFRLLGDMVSAGMDTTAISVEWALTELINNPRVQQKAQEELDRVI